MEKIKSCNDCKYYIGRTRIISKEYYICENKVILNIMGGSVDFVCFSNDIVCIYWENVTKKDLKEPDYKKMYLKLKSNIEKMLSKL